MRLELRCYCCGEPLAEEFCVVTMSEGQGGTDRVFVMRPLCARRADAGYETVRRLGDAVPMRKKTRSKKS